MAHTRILVNVQVRAQNKDFGAVSQTDLTRAKFSRWRKL